MPQMIKIEGCVKIATVEKYLRGEDSFNHLAFMLGVRYSRIESGFEFMNL